MLRPIRGLYPPAKPQHTTANALDSGVPPGGGPPPQRQVRKGSFASVPPCPRHVRLAGSSGNAGSAPQPHSPHPMPCHARLGSLRTVIIAPPHPGGAEDGDRSPPPPVQPRQPQPRTRQPESVSPAPTSDTGVEAAIQGSRLRIARTNHRDRPLLLAPEDDQPTHHTRSVMVRRVAAQYLTLCSRYGDHGDDSFLPQWSCSGRDETATTGTGLRVRSRRPAADAPNAPPTQCPPMPPIRLSGPTENSRSECLTTPTMIGCVLISPGRIVE
jgi:hypothetical protein